MQQTWTQVKFLLPEATAAKTGLTLGAARFFSDEEARKFIEALPSLGCTLQGTDVMFADDAATVIERLRHDFSLNEGKILHLVKANDG